MKKLLIAYVLAVSVLFCSLAQAADRVVVVPLGGTNVYIDPRNITSAAGSVGTEDFVFITVPDDKHFVLTDMFLAYGGGNSSNKYFYLKEGATLKTTMILPASTIINSSTTFSSGLVWGPGSQVVAIGTGLYNVYVTISGYYY